MYQIMLLAFVALFVFSNSDFNQNARSLLTPVSGPDSYALSYYIYLVVPSVLLSMVAF